VRKPLGLFLVQGYFLLCALVLVAVAAVFLAAADFPASRTLFAFRMLLSVATVAYPIVASQRRWRGSRIACAVVLALSLGSTLKQTLAPPPPSNSFIGRHRYEIRGEAEELGANLAKGMIVLVPFCLLIYVAFSRNVKGFLSSGSLKPERG
jgi:hypothetical protein